MTGTDLVAPDQFRALALTDDDLRTSIEGLREQEIGEFDLTRIRIPLGGTLTWEIPSIRGEQSTKEIQGVVLLTKFGRSYWDKPYTGGNEPPTCSSPDGRTARPREIQDPETGAMVTPQIPAQTDPASGRLLCDTCAYAEFGSGRDKDGKPARKQACKQTRMIFMLLPDRMLPVVLVLPPTSLKSAKNYFLGLLDENLPQHAVITHVTLERQQNEGTPAFGVARFRAGDALSAEQAARAAAYAEALRPQFARVVATAADLGDDVGNGATNGAAANGGADGQ